MELIPETSIPKARANVLAFGMTLQSSNLHSVYFLWIQHHLTKDLYCFECTLVVYLLTNMGSKAKQRPRVPFQLPTETAGILRDLTALAKENGWGALGCNRAGIVTQTEVMAEALRLLAAQARK